MVVHEFITSHGKLSDSHREELKTKRGFTDDMIVKGRFFSGGEYLYDCFHELISSFPEQELLQAGVMVYENNKKKLPPQLTQDNIVIPYLDRSSQAYYLRSHKFGFKGVSVEVYHKLIHGKNLILTEGEFKAVACHAWGFSAIAIPGISSFSLDHFPRLVEFLKMAEVKNICIIFDNEVKDNPAFKKRYKPNVYARYDTQYYSYLMAKKILEAGFNAEIGVLPDEWRVNGKVDLDGALAMGKMRDDILNVINQSVSAKEYLKKQPKHIKNIILRKEARRRFKSNIKIDYGCYVARRKKKDGKSYTESISNFTMQIVSTHDRTEGFQRLLILKDEFGKTSRPILIDKDTMPSAEGFKSFCLGAGNFLWKGKAQDLFDIWEWLFIEDEGKFILEPDHIGYLDDFRVWMFENVMITEEGEEILPEESGVFNLPETGVKPYPISMAGMPCLNLNGGIDIDLILKNLSDSIGEFNAGMCLSWISASVYMPEIFFRFGCFPFFFIIGKRGCGKTTVAEWMMNFYGVTTSGKMAEDSTAVFLQRYLSYYSCIPVFVDDFRNVQKVISKFGLFRNAYNRQVAGKGIRKDFGVREERIRGTLLFTGEDTPNDNAFITRCIFVYITTKDRRVNHVDWFNDHKKEFSSVFKNLLVNKDKKKFFETVEKTRILLRQDGVDERGAINYAIISAGHDILLGEGSDMKFSQLLSASAKDAKKTYDAEHAGQQFITDLVYLKTKKLINKDYWEVSDDMVYLYFHGIYQVWAQEVRKVSGFEVFKEKTIRDYLYEQINIEKTNFNVRINGQQKRCVGIKKEDCPDEILSLVDASDYSTDDVKPLAEYDKEDEKLWDD